MKVPLYILGFLVRYGPQHGYSLKQYLKHVSDFASIKLPTIYYHLEKMEKKGLIASSQEREGKRPEKWVFSITSEGKQGLQKMLHNALESDYRDEFLVDAVLYFSDLVRLQQIIDAFTQKVVRLEKHLNLIEEHEQHVMPSLPEEARMYTKALFSHHKHHASAELVWLKETVTDLRSVQD